MTENNVQIGDTSVCSDLTQELGQQLVRAREQMNLSTAEVAKRLRMNVRQIEALEAERWHEFPGSAIVKGFLRSYAKLLNLEAEAVISTFAQANPEREVPVYVAPVVAPLPRQGFGQTITKKMQNALLLLLFSIVALFVVRANWNVISQGGGQPDTTGGANSRNITAVPSAMAVGSAGVQAGSSPASVPVPWSISDLAVRAAVPQDDAMTPLPESSDRPERPVPTQDKPLVLKFPEESWVEILEADNTVLARGLQPAGSELNLQGKPPYRLLIGNARKVSLNYQGKKIDLSPHIGEKVARLTLE